MQHALSDTAPPAATKGPRAGLGEGRVPLLVLPGSGVPKNKPRWVGWGLAQPQPGRAGCCPWARRAPLSGACAAAACGPLLCRPWEAAEPAPGGILDAAFCIAAALLVGGGRLCSSRSGRRRQQCHGRPWAGGLRWGLRQQSMELGVGLSFCSFSGVPGSGAKGFPRLPGGKEMPHPSLGSCCRLTLICCTAQPRSCSQRLLLQKAPPSHASRVSTGQAPLWPPCYPQAAPRLSAGAEAAGDAGTGARPGQGAGHSRSAQPGRLPRSPPCCAVLRASTEQWQF